MKEKGWRVGFQKKEFVGNLYSDDVDDCKLYKWFAEFYRRI